MSNLFNEIKETTDIVSIAGLLGISLHKKGTDYFGKCPFPSHQDKTASFTIGGKKRQKFYCFGCGISGDMFDLVEKILGLTKKEALEWLATNLGIKSGKSNKTPETCRTVDKLKLQNALIQNDSTLLLPKADPVMIDEVYRSLIEKLELKGWAEADLKKRGADLKLFYQLGYRQFPVDLKLRIDIAESISREFHFSNSEKRIPGFFQLPNQKWCFGGNNNGERIFRLKLNRRITEFIPPGLMVPSFDRNGRIQHIKIRTADFPYQKLEIDLEQYFKWSKLSDPAELEKFKDHRKFSELLEGLKYYPPKYTVLSSKNRLNGCATEVSLHFSQLVKFIDRFSDTLIVTEGELKADLINQQTKLPVIALPAVNLRHEQLFEELKEHGKSDANFAKTLGNWREISSEKVPSLKMKTKFELSTCAQQTNIKKLKESSKIFPRILIAFDNDQSFSVRNSLIKLYLALDLRLMPPNTDFIFWRKAKGLDDALGKNIDSLLFQIPLSNII